MNVNNVYRIRIQHQRRQHMIISIISCSIVVLCILNILNVDNHQNHYSRSSISPINTKEQLLVYRESFMYNDYNSNDASTKAELIIERINHNKHSIVQLQQNTTDIERRSSDISTYNNNDPYKQQQQQQQFQERPDLNLLVNGWNVTGDVSFLLQFAIIGFPKCGTSTLMYHLQNQNQFQNQQQSSLSSLSTTTKTKEITFFTHERCELAANQYVPLIKDLYTKMIPNSKHGIKCPNNLETVLAMKNYKTYFYKTDFIVGIRHPVLWFESFYNFRIHNNYTMPSPDKLIGKCKKGTWNVCTDRSAFHTFLSRFGKTNILTDLNERQYISTTGTRTMNITKKISVVPTKRRIFLYDVSQLSDPNINRSIQFRIDLQQFLGLQQPISPFIWYKPGRNHTDTNLIQQIENKKINICDDKYSTVRSVLMNHAINASTWITKYFINSPDVVVSSLNNYFQNTIMKSWETDPCIYRRGKE